MSSAPTWMTAIAASIGVVEHIHDRGKAKAAQIQHVVMNAVADVEVGDRVLAELPRNTKKSSPAPPVRRSLPVPPIRTSLPLLPNRRSLPAPPLRMLSPTLARMMSLPVPPSTLWMLAGAKMVWPTVFAELSMVSAPMPTLTVASVRRPTGSRPSADTKTSSRRRRMAEVERAVRIEGQQAVDVIGRQMCKEGARINVRIIGKDAGRSRPHGASGQARRVRVRMSDRRVVRSVYREGRKRLILGPVIVDDAHEKLVGCHGAARERVGLRVVEGIGQRIRSRVDANDFVVRVAAGVVQHDELFKHAGADISSSPKPAGSRLRHRQYSVRPHRSCRASRRCRCRGCPTCRR